MVVASLAIALVGMMPGKIDVQLKDFKDGDSITRPRMLTVTVDSSSSVNQVEFYVGSSLRTSDSSTPYEFQIDPLNESEGNLKLTFAAYTADGQNSKKEVTVKIDSGIGKGAQANVDSGNDALTKGANDEAIYFGRVALKAQEGFNPARLLLARAYLRKGVYDKAQNFAEEALAADPKFDEANEVLSGIGLRKAFMTLSSGNRKETLESIKASLSKGVAARRKVLDRQIDAMGTPTAENLIPWSKVAIRTGRYKAAINALAPVFRKTESSPEVGNLLAYAQIRNSELSEANYTIAGLERNRSLDGYGYMLKSMLLAMAGKDASADTAMSEAIGNDPDSLATKLAQTYIALKRGRTNVMASMVQNLVRDQSHRPEVNYYLSILLNRQQDYTGADKHFLEAILAEPTLVDALIERGNMSILPLITNRITDSDQKQYQIDLAGVYYGAALEAKADSPQALTGMMIYYSSIGKPSEALTYADAVTTAGPNYAAGHFGAARVYAAVQMIYGDQATKLREKGGILSGEQLKEVLKIETMRDDMRKKSELASRRAATLDPALLEGQLSPNMQVVFNYFQQHGRIPLLVMP